MSNRKERNISDLIWVLIALFSIALGLLLIEHPAWLDKSKEHSEVKSNPGSVNIYQSNKSFADTPNWQNVTKAENRKPSFTKHGMTRHDTIENNNADNQCCEYS